MTRPGYAIGVGPRPQSLIVTMLGGVVLAAFAAHTLKLRMPQRGKITGISLNYGLKGGAHVTSTVDVQKVGVTMLAAAFDVAAGAAATVLDKEGAALAANAADVAKDTELRVVLTEAGGTAPTWADVTVQIDYVPLGD